MPTETLLLTPQQLQQVEQDLRQWRLLHPDIESRRAAYRRHIVDFTLNSMALEREPVDKQRLCALLNQTRQAAENWRFGGYLGDFRK